MGDAIESKRSAINEQLSASANVSTLNYAAPSRVSPPRLMSLDVFRGLVILAMLIVNNIGDESTTGYFWKHAGWSVLSWARAWNMWGDFASHSPGRYRYMLPEQEQVPLWPGAVDARVHGILYNVIRSEDPVYVDARNEASKISANLWGHLPLFAQCTLADLVMPSFMLIIGVAIPFSVSAARIRGDSPKRTWIRVVRRTIALVIIGWILCYFRDQFTNFLYHGTPWVVSLGMDVLQLLGISYFVARLIYELPAVPRFAIASALLIFHWAILRFYPPELLGNFTEQGNALQCVYEWRIWDWISFHIGPVSVGWRGLMSVPPTAATMLLGTLIGDWLQREDVSPLVRASRLAIAGFFAMVGGFLWALDLPFNKPCWTPSYLVYVSGFGGICIAILYWLIDIRNFRRWCYPLVVFGTNAIAVYFLSIMFKVLFLTSPWIRGSSPMDIILIDLKSHLGAWAGGWTWTILYIGMWWIVMDQLYRRKIFWKL